MLINRLIKMYGLRHKYIRIEDQQLNLKMNIIVSELGERWKIFLIIHIKLFSLVAGFLNNFPLKKLMLYKHINYPAKLVNLGL